MEMSNKISESNSAQQIEWIARVVGVKLNENWVHEMVQTKLRFVRSPITEYGKLAYFIDAAWWLNVHCSGVWISIVFASQTPMSVVCRHKLNAFQISPVFLRRTGGNRRQHRRYNTLLLDYINTNHIHIICPAIPLWIHLTWSSSIQLTSFN